MLKINLSQTFKHSWKVLRQNFWLVTNAILLTILIFFALNLLSLYVNGKGIELQLLAFTLSIIVDPFMVFVLIKFFFKIYDGEEVGVTTMFSGVKGFYPFFILYTAINLSIIAGLFLLIVPAFYVITTYAFAAYFLIDKKLSIKASIAESVKITKGTKLEILRFLLILVIINVSGAMLFGVGLILSLPISFISLIAIYRQLSQPKE